MNDEVPTPVDEMQEADLLHEYKARLQHIYRNTARRKAAIRTRRLANEKQLLAECDRDMRLQIRELQNECGIRY